MYVVALKFLAPHVITIDEKNNKNVLFIRKNVGSDIYGKFVKIVFKSSHKNKAIYGKLSKILAIKHFSREIKYLDILKFTKKIGDYLIEL
jgi:hypothetical protein